MLTPVETRPTAAPVAQGELSSYLIIHLFILYSLQFQLFFPPMWRSTWVKILHLWLLELLTPLPTSLLSLSFPFNIGTSHSDFRLQNHCLNSAATTRRVRAVKRGPTGHLDRKFDNKLHWLQIIDTKFHSSSLNAHLMLIFLMRLDVNAGALESLEEWRLL